MLNSRSYLKYTIRRLKNTIRSYSDAHLSTVESGLYHGAKHTYQVVIGIEIHAQLRTALKLFSPARNTYGAEPNSFVHALDLALPGTLPTLNVDCVRQAAMGALALRCGVQRRSYFDRKHYFYPDQPAGFQITQQRVPFAVDGVVHVNRPTNDSFEVRISHVQLEQDTGKTIRDDALGLDLVDLNRCGSALIEIVSKPDMRSALDAGLYVRKVQQLLRDCGASEARMERGDMRCDVNVSVHRVDERDGLVIDGSGRVEVKNLNGVRMMREAIDYEARRHVTLLEADQSVENETRSYDVRARQTLRLRGKEEIADYRFLPEPDLPPLLIDEHVLEQWRSQVPSSVDDRKSTLIKRYELNEYDASVLMAQEGGVAYLEEAMQYTEAPASVVATWMINELFRINKLYAIHDCTQSRVDARRFADAMSLLHGACCSAAAMKRTLALMADSDTLDADTVLRDNDWMLLDEDELRRLCEEVVSDERLADACIRYRGGHRRAMKALVGSLMSRCNGRADAAKASEIIDELTKNGES